MARRMIPRSGLIKMAKSRRTPPALRRYWRKRLGL